MPATFAIDGLVRTVFVTGGDPLTDADLVDAQRRLRAHPEFDPDFRQLFDLRAVTSLREVSSNALRALATRSAFGPRARRALLVSDEPGLYGVARMFATLTDGHGGDVMVFRDP